MSWIGLRHKGTEPLYSDEWNKVVDALDILYGYQASQKAQLDCLEAKVDQYYFEVKRELAEIESKLDRIAPPTKVETYTKVVGTTPVPLSDVDKIVRKIHIKLPSWALYLCYLGDSTKQDFIIEPGDIEELQVENPKSVYIRSLGNVTVYIMLELP